MWSGFPTHLRPYDVSYTYVKALINSHRRGRGLVTAKQSKSHLCTLTGVAVSLLQSNYFALREPQVVLWDRGVLVIHSLMMTQAVVLPKLTLWISYCLLDPMPFAVFRSQQINEHDSRSVFLLAVIALAKKTSCYKLMSAADMWEFSLLELPLRSLTLNLHGKK